MKLNSCKNLDDLNSLMVQLNKIKERIERLKYVDKKYVVSTVIKLELVEITENLCKFICYDLTNSTTQKIHPLSELSNYVDIIENLEKITISETIKILELIKITKTLINEKRYKLLNDSLKENFDVDIFLELCENKRLLIGSYIQSIRKTLKENRITASSLIKLINSITGNDKTIECIVNLVDISTNYGKNIFDNS
jgi:hypothetical protein